MNKVFAQRSKDYDPIVVKAEGMDKPIGTVFDDGTAKRIRIGEWADKKAAKAFAENVQASMNAIKKKLWKIWVE